MIVQLYDGIFGAENFSPYCDRITEQILSINESEYEVRPHHRFATYGRTDDNHNSDFSAIVEEYVSDLALTLKSVYEFDGVLNQSIPVVRYEVGDYMDDHDDMYHNAIDSELAEKVHVYSTVHFLNDEFSGGNLVFPEIDLTITPRKNMLIMFPCHHVHRSEVITHGMKLSSTKFWRDKNAV